MLDSVAKHPRHHLGDFIYEANLKPSRLIPSNPTQRGFSSNPKPLPWDIIKGKLNCILTVKVPRIHLSAPAREEITARGYLWGTDVYTDDSDVVAACIHGGWLKGEWAEDVDAHMLDIDNDSSKRRTKAKDPAPYLDSEGLITSPHSSPMVVPEDRDLHVNVLILPKLAKYAAATRFGISSREFGGEHGSRSVIHDGLSYKVLSLRWVENGAQPQARLRGKARRERMRKAMQEVGHLNGREKSISGNGWWKKDSEENGQGEVRERGASEGDKENRQDEKTPEKTSEKTPEKTSENAEEGEKVGDVEMENGEEETAVEAEK